MSATPDLDMSRASHPAMANPPVDATRDDVRLSDNWLCRRDIFLKRSLDVVISAVLLLLLLPIFLLVGVAVTATSRGPIFYRWRVVGTKGRPFTSYKFRSMVVDADQMRTDLQSRNEMTGPVFKLRDDPRITSIGRWLRRYSVDELPQLWSVFKGDMSLVGPRPPLQQEYERFTPKQRLKLMVRPGITCLWQVNGRNEIKDFNEWVRLDLEYIRTWSLILDFKILFLTIPAVFMGKGR